MGREERGGGMRSGGEGRGEGKGRRRRRRPHRDRQPITTVAPPMHLLLLLSFSSFISHHFPLPRSSLVDRAVSFQQMTAWNFPNVGGRGKAMERDGENRELFHSPLIFFDILSLFLRHDNLRPPDFPFLSVRLCASLPCALRDSQPSQNRTRAHANTQTHVY